jgi:hypothetical protein
MFELIATLAIAFATVAYAGYYAITQTVGGGSIGGGL